MHRSGTRLGEAKSNLCARILPSPTKRPLQRAANCILCTSIRYFSFLNAGMTEHRPKSAYRCNQRQIVALPRHARLIPYYHAPIDDNISRQRGSAGTCRGHSYECRGQFSDDTEAVAARRGQRSGYHAPCRPPEIRQTLRVSLIYSGFCAAPEYCITRPVIARC